MSETSEAEWEAELDRKLMDAIDKHGWFGMTVAPRVDHPDDGPIFEYTLGFETSLSMPNVIVFGLKREVMHHMLGGMYDALKSGHELEDGAVWTELLEGYECVTREVHQSQLAPDYFNYGQWYQRTHVPEAGPYRAFQLFWPGVHDHLLPWEDGAAQTVIEAQPRLDVQKRA